MNESATHRSIDAIFPLQETAPLEHLEGQTSLLMHCLPTIIRFAIAATVALRTPRATPGNRSFNSPKSSDLGLETFLVSFLPNDRRDVK
jgi:hypothetical protein